MSSFTAKYRIELTKLAFGIAFVALACVLVTQNAIAQTPVPGRTITGLNNVLPPVPTLDARPFQGAAPNQRWTTTRDPAQNGPLAEFVKPVNTSDAVLEVILGQSRLLRTKGPIRNENGVATIAVGNEGVISINVMPNAQTIRVNGIGTGVTDLLISTSDDKTYVFEVHVVYDLDLMRVQLRQLFPDALIEIRQIREHLVLDGQARTPSQLVAIETTVRNYLASLSQTGVSGGGGQAADPQSTEDDDVDDSKEEEEYADDEAADERSRDGGPTYRASPDTAAPAPGGGGSSAAQIINLMKVPGVHQVSLEVKIAELNRTAFREIGADIFVQSGGSTFGTQIGGSLSSLAGLGLGPSTTAFGIFPSGNFEIMLQALRRNSVVTIKAEPNLMAEHGQKATFLAGGQFPVPVPQSTGGGGGGNVTIEYKDYGVKLSFIPYILDDETIRLTVAPEVSSIDESVGTTLVPGGDPIPGVNTRQVSTTVELKPEQTLVLAGLLQTEIDAQTTRIPLLGDLPYIGRLFSHTTTEKSERELLVIVTPHLVNPLEADQAIPLPGDDITEPNDLELYLLGRIEGRMGYDHRSTTNWDNPLGNVERMGLEQRHVSGDVGLSE